MGGLIYSLGSNENGKLGIGTKTTRFSKTPILLSKIKNLKCSMIGSGFGHSLALMGKFFF